MYSVYAMCGRLCLLAVISLQIGCITVNLIEPSGPVQEVQLSGTGAGKILLLDLSGVISSQDKDGIVPQPNMLATFNSTQGAIVRRANWGCTIWKYSLPLEVSRTRISSPGLQM